ncbi:hypothetical protein COCSUDRAFT_62910 [Coccomyxa subellipsoidea C-169]|uniref:Uncharacterized protein n=1 Tax=Coccomyxa subellipsoidea (strain C-169) TaxID=574566 RepID=I0YYA4_COCSC|nr:hypothetical protein COCSUDRAFT_62910 [Coccomyxa subellipsoidea C-169]EIE23373.1 hypothetical protein COCSUDRAFT_62910 [Coccomyxa subellipsoidea C-169]|eukprot:XP_005647917.1 hypothetical protein COCSUDRAFT_62910 [Coccomyxa subellipsoidea C-169]
MAGTIPSTFRPVLTRCGVLDPPPALTRLLQSLSLSVIQATCRVQSNFRLQCKRLRVSAPSGPSPIHLAAILQGQPPPPLPAGLPSPRRSGRHTRPSLRLPAPHRPSRPQRRRRAPTSVPHTRAAPPRLPQPSMPVLPPRRSFRVRRPPTTFPFDDGG